MIKEITEIIAASDPKVAAAIKAEYDRENNGIELIASENFVSEAVMLTAGCIMTNKYAEGYPAKRYYGGCQCVDVVEDLARDRACELFGAEHANVQPHSGSQANTAVYFALCNPGDTIMGMSLADGGHLTHGSPVNAYDLLYNLDPNDVNEAYNALFPDKASPACYRNFDKTIQARVNTLWEDLKISGSTEPWVHITSIAIVVIVIVLAAYDIYVKKKRSRDYRIRDKERMLEKKKQA